MYNNQNQNQQSETNNSLYTFALETLCVVIAFIVAALFGAYFHKFTLPFILPIALPVFEGEGLISDAWFIASYVLIFLGVMFFVHLKLTSFGARVVMKPFKEQDDPKSKKGGTSIIWLALGFALFFLSGCNEKEQTDRAIRLNDQNNEHIERIKDKELRHSLTMSRESGSFRLQTQKEDHDHAQALQKNSLERAENEQKSRENHTFSLKAAFYNAEQKARETWVSLIDDTAAPLAKFLAVVLAILAIVIYGVKRLCAMREKLAEEETKQTVAKAFACAMSEEERRKAFEAMGFLNNPNVIDMQAIGE